MTAQTHADTPGNGEIRLIAQGDDMGFAHSANVAGIKCCREGILRGLHVLVPGPWFPEIVDMLAENPDIDVGLEVCLNSDWGGYRWRPLTHAPSLTDEDGYLHWTPKPYKQGRVDIGEVEREIRAQIEQVEKHIPRTSHLCCHMGTATCTPELEAVVEALSQEYSLPHMLSKPTGRIHMWTIPVDEKKRHLIDSLENLAPGLHTVGFHPALDTAETRAMKGDHRDGSARMALHRQTEVDILSSEEVKAVIARRGIRLLSYREALEESGRAACVH
ncbi:MAG: ChbG/HpnK family deacetylase [Kiritimatiellae bacterium]|nr:ChbG/HpnK family deacetylase [Kiritimatiellia bacterium]